MRGMGWITAAALLIARGASAQPPAPSVFPTAELDYRVAPGLSCPTAEDLRAAVAKELRFDAFDGGPGVPVGRFHVVVTRGRPGVLLVGVSFDDPSGARDFDTEFEGTPETARTCSHLVRKHVVAELAMELSLHLARQLARVPPRVPACPEPKPAVAPESHFATWPPEPSPQPLRAPAPDPPKPPERPQLAVRLGAMGWPEFIATDGSWIGFSADVGMRYRWFSFAIEAHGDPPLGSRAVTSVAGNVSVSEARAMGALLLCAHYDMSERGRSLPSFVGCVEGAVGRILFPEHAEILPPSTRFQAAGIRLGLELPITASFIFRAGIDVLRPLGWRPFVNGVTGSTWFDLQSPGFGLGLGGLWEFGLR